MLKSILRTALRSLMRQRLFAVINLFGLSVSMSLGLLIILVVQEQFTFDTFHHESDRIYRINTRALRTNGEVEPYASAPLPLAQVLKQELTLTDQVVRLSRQLDGDAIHGNTIVPIHGLFVDPEFLSVFNFPLAQGNPSTVLTEPTHIMLTSEAAIKMFGRTDVIGQSISIGQLGEFEVVGVLKPFIGKTHFDFEVLAAVSALPLLEKQGKIAATLDDWNNYYFGYVYILLKDGRTVKEVEDALRSVTTNHYAKATLETRDKGYEFYLQALDEITPGPVLSNQMGNGMPDLLIIFLSVLGILVMIMACFNYTQMTIARSLSRAREIGIRKVIGAQRFQVFIQFVGEAVVFALLALIFSYVLLHLLKPAFLQLHIASEFSSRLQEGWLVYLLFFLFAVLTGLLAGVLPAGYLSTFRPLHVLKGSGVAKTPSGWSFRKALIVVQFTLSLVFIMGVLVCFHQVNYMVSKDYGVNERGVLNVRLQGLEYNRFATRASTLPGVIRVGGISHQLGTWADRADDYRKERNDEPFTMRDFLVDHHYIENLELTFLAGGNFDPAKKGPQETHVILNEKALSLFQISDAASAIGQTIYAGDSLTLTILGVVKDFHFRPLNYEVGPLALRYQPQGFSWASVRLVPEQEKVALAALQRLWMELDPLHPFTAITMEEAIDQSYEEAGFNDILMIVGYVSFLAITLACLGMLGMATYAAQARVREVGIRKVMGASAGQITFLLSRSFLILICWAVVVGVPIGYWLGTIFLEQYAYRVNVSFGIVALSVGVITGLGIFAIGSQTYRAAAQNPVQTLRQE